MEIDLGWMVLQEFTHASQLEGGSWRFVFANGAELQAECPWRLILDDRIAITSEDHGHQFGLPSPVDAEGELRDHVLGKKIGSVELRRDTRDLLFYFIPTGRLEIMPLSAGYESWQFRTPDGIHVIAQGGGNLAIWKAP